MLKICFSIVPLCDVSEQVSKVDGVGERMKLLYFSLGFIFRIINFPFSIIMWKYNRNNDVTTTKSLKIYYNYSFIWI